MKTGKPIMLKTIYKVLFLSVLSLVLLSQANANDSITVSAYFDPPTINTREAGKFIIEVNGTTQSPRGNLPPILQTGPGAVANPRISMRYMGPQTAYRSINGRRSEQGLYIYTVTAEHAGDFTLPSFTIQIDNEQYIVPESKLTVTNTPSPEQETLEQKIKLQLHSSKTEMYVGESLPIEIQLYFHQNLTGQLISPFPKQKEEAFNEAGFPEPPEKITVTEGNQRFNTFTWKTILTPIKAGTYPLSYSLKIALNENDDDIDMRNPFSAIFAQMSNTFKEYILLTPSYDFQILPLPEESKPEIFNGAIGNFSIFSSISSNKAEVGEPLELSIRIKGSGNFDRLAAPVLSLNEKWKFYPPKESFEPLDKHGYTGNKQFDYVIIPQSEDITEIPLIEFAYFDPYIKQYVTQSIAPTMIHVLPSSAPQITQQPNVTPIDDGPIIAKPQLAPIITSIGKVYSNTTPLFMQSWFQLIQLAPLLIILSVYLRQRRKRLLEKDSRYAKEFYSNQQINELLNNIKKAAKENNSLKFYQLTQKVIQINIGKTLETASESLTYPEAQVYLKAKNAKPSTLQQVKTFFDAADIIRFSGEAASTLPLSQKLTELEQLLSTLSKLK